MGRYCEWEHRTVDRSSEIDTFEEYKETLVYKCEDGEPGYMNWTVPLKAPDLLYYQVSTTITVLNWNSLLIHLLSVLQCFTHNNLGWKINVVDAGASAAPAVHRQHLQLGIVLTVISLVVRGLRIDV